MRTTSIPPLAILLRDIRTEKRMGMIILGMSCFAGGFTLYVSIDCFLRGEAFLSAVTTVLSFANFSFFDTAQQTIKRLRAMEEKVRYLIVSTNPPPPSSTGGDHDAYRAEKRTDD